MNHEGTKNTKGFYFRFFFVAFVSSWFNLLRFYLAFTSPFRGYSHVCSAEGPRGWNLAGGGVARSDLEAIHLTLHAAGLPVRTDLLSLRRRGHRALRVLRSLVGCQKTAQMPAFSPRGLRSGAGDFDPG